MSKLVRVRWVGLCVLFVVACGDEVTGTDSSVVDDVPLEPRAGAASLAEAGAGGTGGADSAAVGGSNGEPGGIETGAGGSVGDFEAGSGGTAGVGGAGGVAGSLEAGSGGASASAAGASGAAGIPGGAGGSSGSSGSSGSTSSAGAGGSTSAGAGGVGGSSSNPRVVCVTPDLPPFSCDDPQDPKLQTPKYDYRTTMSWGCHMINAYQSECSTCQKPLEACSGNCTVHYADWSYPSIMRTTYGVCQLR